MRRCFTKPRAKAQQRSGSITATILSSTAGTTCLSEAWQTQIASRVLARVIHNWLAGRGLTTRRGWPPRKSKAIRPRSVVVCWQVSNHAKCEPVCENSNLDGVVPCTEGIFHFPFSIFHLVISDWTSGYVSVLLVRVALVRIVLSS
jgi:hypothetical protein